jgi:hypothetical protein
MKVQVAKVILFTVQVFIGWKYFSLGASLQQVLQKIKTSKNACLIKTIEQTMYKIFLKIGQKYTTFARR